MPVDIDLPNLSGFSQPEWNDAQSVSGAFDAILRADSEKSSEAAYHRLLYALGNNHAGTYYSIALGILPVIDRILHYGPPWSRRSVLEVLIELCGSFEPAEGQDSYHGESLAGLINKSVSGFAPTLNSLVLGGG